MTVIRRDSLSILKRHASLALLGGVMLSACSNSGTPGVGQFGTSQYLISVPQELGELLFWRVRRQNPVLVKRVFLISLKT